MDLTKFVPEALDLLVAVLYIVGTFLADKIHEAIISEGLYYRDRGVKEGDLHVIRESNMAACLIELAFIDNAKDVELLKNKQKEFAIAICKGIQNYFGLEYQGSSSNGIDPSNGNVYYSTHMSQLGWTDTESNGETSGQDGSRMEALTIRTDRDTPIEFKGHIQNRGWGNMETDGGVVGTVGEGLRLEAIALKFKDNKKNIAYRVKVQGEGWQGWRYNGDIAGTTGQGKALEAIEIHL